MSRRPVKARAAEYGIGAGFGEYQKMYGIASLDGVAIATPRTLHGDLSIAAFGRGNPCAL